MRKSSSAQNAAHSSGDYVTHWPAVLGAAGVIFLLLLGAFYIQLTGGGQDPPMLRGGRVATSAEDLRSRDSVSKQLTLRRDADESLPPTIDPAKMHSQRGVALRPLRYLGEGLLHGVASSSAQRYALAKNIIDRAEQQTRPSRAVPDDIVAVVVSQGHGDYPRSAEQAIATYLREEVTELDMQSETKSFLQVATLDEKDDDPHAKLLEQRAKSRHDLQGLPLQLFDCRSDRDVAVARHGMAFGVRSALMRSRARSRSTQSGYGTSDETKRFLDEVHKELKRRAGEDATWQEGKQVAILEQMMQIESFEQRHLLIELLGRIAGWQSSEALARRVLFDPDETVRQAASAELRQRPTSEFRTVIDHGKNYPWTPVAQRASYLNSSLRPPNRDGTAGATASSGARQQDTMQVVSLGTHVSSPYETTDGEWVVDELVKVNHLRNCVMCHQVSLSQDDPLRGQIPTPGQRLPPIYYSSKQGNFVRADTVYLRQDFSMMLPVEDSDPWPQMQRFDFFVRTRAATGDDVQREYKRRADGAFRLQHHVVRVVQWLIDAAEGNARAATERLARSGASS